MCCIFFLYHLNIKFSNNATITLIRPSKAAWVDTFFSLLYFFFLRYCYPFYSFFFQSNSAPQQIGMYQFINLFIISASFPFFFLRILFWSSFNFPFIIRKFIDPLYSSCVYLFNMFFYFF